MTRGGKYYRSLRDGIFFIVPFLDEVKALRSPYTMANGVFAACTTAGKVLTPARTTVFLKR